MSLLMVEQTTGALIALESKSIRTRLMSSPFRIVRTSVRDMAVFTSNLPDKLSIRYLHSWLSVSIRSIEPYWREVFSIEPLSWSSSAWL